MYPINKYLFESVFDKNNEMFQEFMCSVDTDYIDTINILTPFLISNAHFFLVFMTTMTLESKFCIFMFF